MERSSVINRARTWALGNWALATLPLLLAICGPTEAVAASFAERSGSTFLEAPADPYQSPRAKVIEIPHFPGAHAIWGSTGRDSRGHIWFGVSADGGDHSAHLMEYDPVRNEVTDRGDVISELKAAGLYKPGERQIKIHSRIVPADDGYLYFSSADEQGEEADGSAPPKWGSHLWRLRPGDERWRQQVGAFALGPGRPDGGCRRRSMDLCAWAMGPRALPVRHPKRRSAPCRGWLGRRTYVAQSHCRSPGPCLCASGPVVGVRPDRA